ncbi:MAG: NAD(P)/FAD-dependent oxidoreductase [Pseudomonadales bacterium]
MAARQPDAIIVGAGVIGCSIAWALARRGIKTLNLDALPAAGYGSTSHSSAIIRPFYSHITSCALAHEARFLWQRWPETVGTEDERGFARYTECGGLILIREGEEDAYSQNLSVLDEVGVDYELLDSARVAELYPGTCLDAFGPPRPMADENFGQPSDGRIGGGIFLPQAGYVSDPQLAAHNLQVAAEALGAEFRFSARIVSIERDGQAVRGVRLDNGETLRAPIVVNAAGPHSRQINELAGVADSLKITTQPHRYEVAYVTAPAAYIDHGNGFVVDLDAGVYQRPDGKDLLIGSADPDCDPPDIVDPDDYNPEFTEQWTLQVYRAAQRFPMLGIENTARGTVGLYDVSDDWIPMYDKTDLEGFYLAIGTSGNQFKNAPLVGDLLAEIIMAAAAGRDHDETPARLELPHVGRSVDLSFYSRNRKLQKTRSVLA